MSKIKDKVLTLRLTLEEHKNLKVLSALKGMSIKSFILSLVKRNQEDLEFASFLENHNNALYDEEEITEEEIKRSEIADREIAAGEFEDLEEVIKELENEGKTN